MVRELPEIHVKDRIFPRSQSHGTRKLNAEAIFSKLGKNSQRGPPKWSSDTLEPHDYSPLKMTQSETTPFSSLTTTSVSNIHRELHLFRIWLLPLLGELSLGLHQPTSYDVSSHQNPGLTLLFHTVFPMADRLMRAVQYARHGGGAAALKVLSSFSSSPLLWNLY